MSDPERLGDQLGRARAALERRQATSPILQPDDGEDDIEATVAAGAAAAARARWTRVCPSRFLWATTGDFDEEIRVPLDEWANTSTPPNLLIVGPVGAGKSHAALAACRPAHDRRLEVRFLPVVELLDLLRPGGPDHALEELMHVDRLIIDDLGTEKATDWTAERLYALINRRWLEERPTIGTTNLIPRDLAAAVGERTYSRLIGGATTIRLTGGDRRRS